MYKIWKIMMIKLKIHSSVDVITNSSTVIFTYQNSIQEVKELVEEIIKLTSETDLTADDVFFYGKFCDADVYAESEGVVPEEYEGNTKMVENLIVAVLSGEMEKPEWMTQVENNEDYYDYYNPDIYLHILPKEEKYKALGQKLLDFLNSPSHEATRDG